MKSPSKNLSKTFNSSMIEDSNIKQGYLQVSHYWKYRLIFFTFRISLRVKDMINVLFIDDDKAVQNTLRMVLPDRYVLIQALTGEEGMKKLVKEKKPLESFLMRIMMLISMTWKKN